MLGIQSGVIPDYIKNFPKTQTSNIFHIIHAEKDNQRKGSSYDRSKEPCKCPKVLIADDEPFNLIALEGLLHQFNVGSVDKAYHGKEALQKIE